VLLRPDGLVKVLDFGLAKLTAASDPNVSEVTQTVFRTEEGTVLGTAACMSPEQAKGQAVYARTDIWSLGVVLYEMVAGRLPFAASSTSEVLAAILDRDPPPIVQFEPKAPTEMQRIVRKALRKDRDQRYQTARDLLLDLQALGDDLRAKPPPIGGLTQEGRRRPARVRTNRRSRRHLGPDVRGAVESDCG
jgi:eukaryotic-like serine/threonine-protein kinase